MHEEMLLNAVCPSALETFSFWKSPCRYEMPMLGKYDTAGKSQNMRCPFIDYCSETSLFLRPLTNDNVYGSFVKVSHAEPSSSIVVRSEHQYNREERRRLSLRKHIYEGNTRLESGVICPSERTPIPYSDLKCSRFSPTEKLISYLGFFDSRLNNDLIEDGKIAKEYPELNRSPIALGVLAPPRWLREAGAKIILGNYGPVFGGPSFEGTVYAMQDVKTAGALCAQMCLVMSLGMLSDRGAHVCGSHTLTFRVLDRIKVNQLPNAEERLASSDCDIHLLNSDDECYIVDGLTPQYCETALNRVGVHGSRVSARCLFRLGRAHFPDRLLLRVIQGYIDARCPVMLFVDNYPWNQHRADWKKADYPAEFANSATSHAVLAIGYLKTGPRVDDLSIITHDPGRHPFLMRNAATTLESLWNYPASGQDADGNPIKHRGKFFNIMPIADEGVRIHLGDCLAYLMFQDEGDGKPLQGTQGGFGDLNVFAFRQYYLGSPALLDKTNLLFRLALPHDFLASPELEQLLRTKPRGIRQRMLHEFRELLSEPGRYWFILGSHADGQTGDLWAFSAERGGIACPDAYIDFHLNAVRPGDPLWKAKIDEIFAPVNTIPHLEPGSGTKQGRTEPKPPADPIRPAVMSSSSGRPLVHLFGEMPFATGVNDLDLLLLRDEDLFALRELGTIPELRKDLTQWNDKTAPSDVLIDRDGRKQQNWEIIADWIAGQRDLAAQLVKDHTPSEPATISAFATYFPDITSTHLDRQKKAQASIVNSIKLAYKLASYGVIAPKHPVIVEIVCGSLIEPCMCFLCRSGEHRCLCSVPRNEDKIRILTDGLEAVVKAVYESIPQAVAERPFALALELEPGETYLLNSKKQLDAIFQSIGAKDLVAKHVGLNLDVAHMLIAGVTAEDLNLYRDKIVNAHICDHPRMHTRDQSMGTWTSVFTSDSPYLPYIRMLCERYHASKRQSNGLAFSGCMSLELEGCNRIDWIYRSVPTMRHLIHFSIN